MDNLIKLLKKNEKPFGLMSEEMQEKQRKMGDTDFQVFRSGEWMNYDASYPGCNSFAYRLRDDYKDEPETTIRQMEISANMSNCLCMYNDEGQSFGSIAKVHERADFTGFKFEDGTVMGSPVKYSVPGMTLKGYYASYEDLKTSQALEHRATHVLFRKQE